MLIGISKKLEKQAKKTGNDEIRPWIKSIANHCYWVADTCGTNAKLKVEKWLSISNHITNKHQHESELFPKCEQHDSRTGIKKEDQPNFNIIAKCGRYVESGLRWIAIQKEGYISTDGTRCESQILTRLVKGRFDSNTAQLFKALQKGASGLDDQALRNVRIAAELSGVGQLEDSMDDKRVCMCGLNSKQTL